MFTACNRIPYGQRKQNADQRYCNTDAERPYKQQSVTCSKKLRVCIDGRFPYNSAVQPLLEKTVYADDEKRKDKKHGKPCRHRKGVQKGKPAPGIIVYHSLTSNPRRYSRHWPPTKHTPDLSIQFQARLQDNFDAA